MLGWGVEGGSSPAIRSALLECAPRALTNNGRFQLLVLDQPQTLMAFRDALRVKGLLQGVWLVEYQQNGRVVLLTWLVNAADGSVDIYRSGLIGDRFNQPCDLACRLVWELMDRPLDPAAANLLEQARAAWKAGKYLDADGLFRKVLIVSDHAYMACRDAGRMWDEAGRPDIALQWYQLALDRNRYDYLTYWWMARIFEQNGQDEQALDAYEKALANGPRMPALLMALARQYKKLERFGEVQHFFAEAAALNPADAEILIGLFYAADKNEDWAAAAAALKKLLEMGVGGDPQRQMLAEYRTKAGDYAGALETLNDLLTRHPGEQPLIHSFIQMNLELGRLDVAEARLLALIKEYPDDIWALTSLGGVYFQTRRFQPAVEVLERAAAGAPGDRNIQRTLGKAYELSGDLSGALNSYERFLNRQSKPASDDIDRYLELANKLNQPERAISTLQRLMRSARRADQVQYALAIGRLEEERGNLRAAIDVYLGLRRSAAASSARINFEIGRLYLKSNEVNNAADSFSRLLATDADARTLFSAGRLMQKAGRFDSAIDLFGAAYFRDRQMTLAGLLYLEELMLTGQDRDNGRILWELDQQINHDVEREFLLWLELIWAARQNNRSFFEAVRAYALDFIAKRPTTQLELTRWQPILRPPSSEPQRVELLDLFEVFNRRMPVKDFAAKYQEIPAAP